MLMFRGEGCVAIRWGRLSTQGGDRGSLVWLRLKLQEELDWAKCSQRRTLSPGVGGPHHTTPHCQSEGLNVNCPPKAHVCGRSSAGGSPAREVGDPV